MRGRGRGRGLGLGLGLELELGGLLLWLLKGGYERSEV